MTYRGGGGGGDHRTPMAWHHRDLNMTQHEHGRWDSCNIKTHRDLSHFSDCSDWFDWGLTSIIRISPFQAERDLDAIPTRRLPVPRPAQCGARHPGLQASPRPQQVPEQRQNVRGRRPGGLQPERDQPQQHGRDDGGHHGDGVPDGGERGQRVPPARQTDGVSSEERRAGPALWLGLRLPIESCHAEGGGRGGGAHTSPRLGLPHWPGTEHSIIHKVWEWWVSWVVVVDVTLEKSEVAGSYSLIIPHLPAASCSSRMWEHTVCKPIQYKSCTFGCMHLQFSWYTYLQICSYFIWIAVVWGHSINLCPAAKTVRAIWEFCDDIMQLEELLDLLGQFSSNLIYVEVFLRPDGRLTDCWFRLRALQHFSSLSTLKILTRREKKCKN